MSEYYGAPTTPTDSFLAHYGVRGMKWGVRRAKMKGDMKKLSRAHERAAKKLAKLNERTDIEVQNAKANKYNNIAKAHTKVGVAGLGALGLMSGAYYGGKLAGAHLLKKKGDALNLYRSNLDGSYTARMAYRNAADHYNEMAGKAFDISDKMRAGGDAHSIVGGMTIGALGLAAYNKGKSIAAKQRTTSKGHAKAVAKRDAWRNQMNEVFAGTKYQGQYTHPSNKKKRRARNG